MIIGIDLDNSKFTKSMTSVQRSIRSSAAEMKAQMGVFSASGRNIDAMRAKHDGLIKTLTLEQKNMMLLRKKYDEVSNGGKNYNSTVAKLQNQINKSVSEQARLKMQIDQTNKAYIKASSSATIFRDKLTNIGSKMKDTGQNMTQAFGPATAAMGLGLGYAVKSAADFEQTMSGVKSVMDPADVQKYSGALEHLAIVQGAKTKYSATQAAQAEEELVKAGVSVSDIMHGALAGSLSLATAGELDLKDAAEIASTALNAFRNDHLSVAKAADILAGAANASATDVSELKFSLSMVSAVAAGVGLSFKDTSTALAVFAQNGLKGSDAGTSLKTMLSRLTPMTNTAYDEFERLGLMTVDTSAAMKALRDNGVKPMSKDSGDLVEQLHKLAAKLSDSKEGSAKATKEFYILASQTGAVHSAFYKNNGQLKNMADIAQILRTHLHDLNGEQRQQALYTIFGSDAIRGANILFREGAKGVDAMASAMGKIKAADVAKQKMDNFKGTLEQLRGSLETAGITIGEADLPMLKALAKDIQGVVDGFNHLSPEMQHFIAGSLTVGTAGLGVATGLGAMMTVIGGGIDATGKLAGRVGALNRLLRGTRAAAEGEAAIGLASTASKAGLLASVLPLLASPLGVLTLSLGAVGLAAWGVNKYMYGLEDTNTKYAASLVKQHDDLAKQINEFDSLKNKCYLTRSELGKYIDLQDALSKAKSPEAVKKLKDQMDKLQEKSGLSRKELTKVADLSQTLAKKVPEGTDAVTKEGKAFAYTTDKIKSYNKAKLDQAMNTYQQKYDAARANEVKVQRELTDSQQRLTSNVKEETTYRNLANEANTKGWKVTIKKYEEESKYSDQAKYLLSLLQNHGELLYKRLDYLNKQNNALRTTISHDKSQLKLAGQIADKMTSILLQENGINTAKRSGLYAVEVEIGKQKSILDRLREQHAAGKLNTAEYNAATKSVQDQIRKLQGVEGKVIDITGSAKVLNTTLSKKILKEIKFTGDTKQDAISINQALAKQVHKFVEVGVKMPAYKQIQLHGLMYPGNNANGTSNWRGGATWLAEGTGSMAGPEAVHIPGKGTGIVSQMGVYDLPAGSSVLSAPKTKGLLDSLGVKLPGFASGVGNYFDQLLGKGGTVSMSLNQLPDAINGLTDELSNLINNMINKQLAQSPGGSGVSRWVPTIQLAAGMMGVKLTGSMMNAILARIKKESGGNPTVLQKVVDINSLRGHPARGLLQYIPSTFNAWKVGSYGDIKSGLAQLLAMFNDSNWYRDIRAPGGWGPTGRRRYADGGFVNYEQVARIGEGGKTEMVLPLTNQARSIQLMQQALGYMSNNQSGTASVAPMMDTGRIETLLAQNNQLMAAFMQLVDQKPTGITPQAVFNANKQVADQNTRNRNLAMGVMTL
jgi:SLT domain-containing protein